MLSEISQKIKIMKRLLSLTLFIALSLTVFAQGTSPYESAINATLIRGPYLNMGNQTAITLRWRTDIAKNTQVEIGTTFGAYPSVLSDATLTTEHEIRITGLNSDTKYYYRFGSTDQILQAGTDNYFTTAPPTNTTRKMRFAVFGDCGRNDNGYQTQTLAAYQNYLGSNAGEVMILLGDNAYNSGLDAEYQTGFFQPYQTSILKNHVLMPAPGNHDYYGTSQSVRYGAYYQNFTMPTAAECGGVASGTEAYYSWDRGDVHFISLDSYGTENPNATRLYDTTGAQVTWLKQDLEANNKKWTILYWHHPPYTMGSHNSDTEGELVNIRANLLKILERYGVDLVLCGHSHDYERSYLLRGHYGVESEFDINTHVVSSSSSKYDGSGNSCPYNLTNGRTNHGVVYVVAGSSGASGGVQANYPHNALPWSFNEGGMLHLEIEGNRLDAKFIRRDQTIADNFTIMKDVNKTTDIVLPAGNSTILKASWLGNYAWNTSATTQSITVTPTMNSSYTVTDGLNCLTDVFNVKLKNIPIAMKVFLEGAYSDGNMRTDLSNTIPLTEPFAGLSNFIHQNGGGGESTTRNIITNNAIVDWVFIELTSPTTPSVIYTRSALLKSNGSIVDVDGVSVLRFPELIEGDYTVTIKHRNHLKIKTNTTISLKTSGNTLDFTNNTLPITGALKTVTTGVYALYAGDVNADGTINAADRSNAWNVRNSTGYNQNDCSMNGIVDATDRSMTWNNRNLSSGF